MTKPKTSHPRERLTHDRVVEAALKLMDTEGLEAVTMRHLARELGVEAMSLYNHVDSKEAIHDGICERVLSEIQIPEESDDWVIEARQLARSFRQVLGAHPNVVTLISNRDHPIRAVGGWRPMDAALRLFRRAGLPDRQVSQAYNSFGGFIFGSVLIESGQLMVPPGNEQAAQQALAEIARVLPLAELPTLADLLPEIIRCDPAASFEFGLDMLIAGLQAMVAAGKNG